MKKILLILSLLLTPVFATATEPMAPDELVRALTDEVLEVLRTDDHLAQGETEPVVRAIEKLVLPHFNLRRMTALAVGRDWRDATPEQQERLVDAFYEMLVRTYSNALTEYRDQRVDFRPLRMSPDDRSVRVQTLIIQTGGAQPVAVDYMMGKTEGGWKAFDVVIAGVSLVTNYRSTFQREIRANGIEGLIKSLETNEIPVDTGTP
ncbi:MAG TPA: ABC transporter substrate-binding protein [Azoarcus sp.]|nr:ABC transporter substrate-binding protein [Azoarcus sp.]